MNNEIDEAAKGKMDDESYEVAVLEFNLATLPLIVALTAHRPPSVAELKREEIARATVVEARRKAWASSYGQG